MNEKNLFEVISENLPPRKRRRATEAQISFAESIADALDLPCPNFDDFSETSKFISDHKDEYYAWKEDRDRDFSRFARPRDADDDGDDDFDIPF